MHALYMFTLNMFNIDSTVQLAVSTDYRWPINLNLLLANTHSVRL